MLIRKKVNEISTRTFVCDHCQKPAGYEICECQKMVRLLQDYLEIIERRNSPDNVTNATNYIEFIKLTTNGHKVPAKVLKGFF